MNEKKVSRRGFAKTAATGIVGLAAGAAIGYGAASMVAPPSAPGATKTVTTTKTVAEPGAPEFPVVGDTVTERALNAAKEVKKRDNIPDDFELTILVGAAMVQSHEDTREQWENATGIKLRIASTPPEELYAKAVTESVTKTGMYEVLHIEPYMIGEFAPAELLKDITDWARRYDARLHGQPDGYVYPYDWQMCYFNNRVYGLPTDADTAFMLCRNDLYGDSTEQANFERQYGYPLEYPKLWTQYYDIAEFFNRPPDLYGTIESRDYWGYWAWFMRHAATKWPTNYPWDDDMGANVNNAEGYLAAKQYAEVTKFMHPDVLQLEYGEELDLLGKGKCATAIFPASSAKFTNDPSLSTVIGKLDAPWELPGNMVDSPFGERLLWKSVQGGGFTATVSNYAKYPELAYLYIQFYTSPENIVTASISQGSWLDPCRYNQMGENADPRQLKAHGSQVLNAFVPVSNHAVPLVPIRGLHEYCARLKKNLDDIILGLLSVEEGMEKTEKEWNEATDRFGRDEQIKTWLAYKPWYGARVQ